MLGRALSLLELFFLGLMLVSYGFFKTALNSEATAKVIAILHLSMFALIVISFVMSMLALPLLLAYFWRL